MIFETNELLLYIFGFNFGFFFSLLILEINETKFNFSKSLKDFERGNL